MFQVVHKMCIICTEIQTMNGLLKRSILILMQSLQKDHNTLGLFPL